MLFWKRAVYFFIHAALYFNISSHSVLRRKRNKAIMCSAREGLTCIGLGIEISEILPTWRIRTNLTHLPVNYVRHFSVYHSPVHSYKDCSPSHRACQYIRLHHPFFLKAFLKSLKLEKSQCWFQGEFTDLLNHTRDRGALTQRVYMILHACAYICTLFSRSEYGYFLRDVIRKAF